MTLLYVLYCIGLTVSCVLHFKWGEKRGHAKGLNDGRTRGRRELETQPVDIICLCGHGPNFHNEKGCIQTVRWELRGPVFGSVSTFDKDVRCKCLKYTGPEFLPTYVDRIELEMRK